MSAAVVLGDGVDALVAAHYLARAGHDVTVLRDRDSALESEREVGWVPPHVVRTLELDRHGFDFEERDGWARVPLGDGGFLDLVQDVAACAEAIRRLSPRDAARWPDFCSRMHALARFLGTIYVAPPPDPLAADGAGMLNVTQSALRFRRLGRQSMEDLLRLMPMSAADFVDEWFESDVLKGALAAAALLNLCQGPRSGGTAFSFLHHHVGSPAGVFRPVRSNAHPILRSLTGPRMHGGTASHVAVRGGRVAAVVLASGDEIPADVVVSAADPKRTLLELCDPGSLDPALVRSVRAIRSRGVAGRVEFVLARDPGFSSFTFAPSLDYLERAYDDVKYGRISAAPWLSARAVKAPASERWRVEAHVQYVPYAATDAQDARALLGAHVRERLAEYAPAMADAEIADVVTPRDMEERCGFPQGQPYHAELALDQVLWMRPVPELAQYRTPIAGLYLCGPAMHPGGAIVGAAGANAASVILRDLKRRKKA
ncbi:MAG: phytoene desaturase family protein [Burkholderiales bacterium]